MYENSTRNKYAVVKLERFMKFQSNTVSVQCVQQKLYYTKQNNTRIVLEFNETFCYIHYTIFQRVISFRFCIKYTFSMANIVESKFQHIKIP